MTYKIIKTDVYGDTINTTVEYNFDGKIITIDVAHFMPQNQQDIETGILNRAASEKRRIDAEEFNRSLVENITIGEEKPIN